MPSQRRLKAEIDPGLVKSTGSGTHVLEKKKNTGKNSMPHYNPLKYQQNRSITTIQSALMNYACTLSVHATSLNLRYATTEKKLNKISSMFYILAIHWRLIHFDFTESCCFLSVCQSLCLRSDREEDVARNDWQWLRPGQSALSHASCHKLTVGHRQNKIRHSGHFILQPPFTEMTNTHAGRDQPMQWWHHSRLSISLQRLCGWQGAHGQLRETGTGELRRGVSRGKTSHCSQTHPLICSGGGPGQLDVPQFPNRSECNRFTAAHWRARSKGR